jgi:para-aminobenzoate synthetase/4-amino-4-deoxychorismate lyase
MQAAANHFAVPWDAGRVEAALEVLTNSHPSGLWRVRLLLDAQGQPQAQAFALEPNPEFVRLEMAKQPILEAHSEFVRFKTTRRAHYDAFTPSDPGVFDTILWNSAGEITEGTRGNLAFCIEGRWITPPVACGLLSGIGRAEALKSGRVVEGVVRLADLERVTEVGFVNSLRGWLPAQLT